jgi:hypothetical protein
MGAPGYVAVDGSNNAWIASLQGSRLSELSVTLSGSGSAATIGSIQSVVANASGLVTPTTGGIPFTPSAGANWLGIDPSGNVWVLSSKAQSNGSTNQTNYVTVYVGTATPVITPLVYQVQYNRIGQTPQ